MTGWGLETLPSAAQQDLFQRLGIRWLKAGEEKQVLVFAPGDKDPHEVIDYAEHMVEAHDVEWVGLQNLTRQRIGKGPDGFRWRAEVVVRGRADPQAVEVNPRGIA